MLQKWVQIWHTLVLAAALSGMGIPLFMQSIRAAITESFSHSVPNKL
jgi:hypothetical protein